MGRLYGDWVSDLTRTASPPAGQLIDRVPPQALMITGMLTTQLGAAVAKQLFEHNSPASIGMLRLAFAALVLMVALRPRLNAIDRRDAFLVVGFGVATACMNLAFYEALARIPLGVAVTVEFLGPLGVAVAASRRPVDVLWAALAAGGVVAFWRAGGSVPLLGLGFAFLAGAGWACYILLNAAAGRRFAGVSGLALAMSVGALFSVPFGLADATSHLLSPSVLGAAFVVAMASSALPYSFETAALRRLSPGVFGVVTSLQPAVAALVGLVVLGEGLGWREWLGIALVITASAGASRRRLAESPAPPPD